MFRAATILLGVILTLLPSLGWTAESAPFADARGTATLVAESDGVAPGRPLRVALRLRLAPGWHTYWRNPGDAGIPAELDWRLPAGVTVGPIAWPAPERLTEGELVTHGLVGDVLLPGTLAGLAGPATIGLHATWLACAKVCVPEEAELSLALPSGDGGPGAEAPLFRAADARAPRPVPWSARITPAGVLDVTADEVGPAQVRAATFFANDPDRIAAGAAQRLTVRPGGIRLLLRPAAGAKLDRALAGVLAVTDGAGATSAYQITASPVATLPDAATAPPLPLPTALGFALLGGLILNLMPCVFPVLAMKAAGLARLAGHRRGPALRHAAAYAAGTVLSFCAIGAALIALRAAGSVAGWGFQFTSPGFVAATAWLLFAVGLNLSGVFSLARFGFAGAGQSLAGRGGALGSFFTGALAVLVATPCTAPFMGAALAVALAAAPVVAMGVFAAMGVGLALPYVLLALVPGASRRLPRPGAWMDTFRQVLAFPMYATAVWLLWVVAQQAGADGAAVVAGGAVALGFAAWLVGRSERVAGAGARAAGVAVVAVLAGLAAGATALRPAESAPTAALAGAEPFTAERLAGLRAAGRPVLVDMSAAWCITCLVNERVALDRAAVRAALVAADVTLLRGDWTRQDPGITAFLREHGRDGVPLYVFYPPHGGAPVLLPQILTEGIVLDALRPVVG